jgi:hypothetical protein
MTWHPVSEQPPRDGNYLTLLATQVAPAVCWFDKHGWWRGAVLEHHVVQWQEIELPEGYEA